MKTYVYIDGLNLFHGALKGTSNKRLDVAQMCSHLLQVYDVEKIKYFTAPMKVRFGDTDIDKPQRQQMYLRALKTLSNIEIIEGFFTVHNVSMKRSDGKGFVDVVKTEEKGTDVKIATHLLHDGHQGLYETAVVISNDADLAEPIRIVVQDLKLPVIVISPFRTNTLELARVASSRRKIREGVLRISQFPKQLSDSIGTFQKPAVWS